MELPEPSDREKQEFALRNGDGGLDALPEHYQQTPETEESDFDWEDDATLGNEEENGRDKIEKTRSCWTKLSKFTQTFLIVVLGGGVLAAPSIVIGILKLLQMPSPDNGNVMVNTLARNNIMLWTIWAAFILSIWAITRFVVDLVPWQVVKFCVWFTGSCSEKTKTRLEYFIAVSRWIKVVLVTAWSWGTFAFLVQIPFSDEYNASYGGLQYISTIIKVNMALWGASLVILVQKFIVQLMAIRFHRVAYYDRIKENKKGLWALDQLAGAKKVARRKYKNGSAPLSRANSFDGHHGSKGHSGPTTPGEKLQRPEYHHQQSSYNTAQEGQPPIHQHHQQHQHHHHPHMHSKRHHDLKAARKRLTTNITGNLTKALQQITLKNDRLLEQQDINSGLNAKKLARKLFHGLQNDRTHLIPEDFEPYFPNAHQATEAFTLFDKDGNQDISPQEMREAIVRIYKERKALNQSLRDLGNVTGKLDKIFFVLALIVILFIFLGIFESNVVASLVPISTFLVAFSFIFGTSLKNLFESILFIFFQHVMDSGDLVCFEDNQYWVHNMGLMSTVLRRVDGQEVYIPNSILAQKEIYNYRRSPSQAEVIPIDVDFYTAHDKIVELRHRLRDWIVENQREFEIVLDVHLYQMKANALTLNVIIVHKANWHDWGGRWNRRTRFMEALRDTCHELDIQLVAPMQSVHMVESPQPKFTSPISPQSRSATTRRAFSNRDPAMSDAGLSSSMGHGFAA